MNFATVLLEFFTKTNFARSPVDLTLEQIINAAAGNQLSDNLTVDSLLTCQRWVLSQSTRTKILSNVKCDVKFSRKADTSHALHKNAIKKDNKGLESIIDAIKNTINTFEETIYRNNLFNISTGKAAYENVTNFLLKAKT